MTVCETSWSITIPAPPSVNAMFYNRKTDDDKGRRGRGATESYRAWKSAASDALWLQKPLKTFAGEVAVCIAIEHPRGPADLDNRIKATLDFLVHHGIIVNDSFKYVKMILASWDASVKGCKVTIASIDHREIGT